MQIIIPSCIHHQLSQNTKQFSHSQIIDWKAMSDQDLQQYENQLLSLYSECNPQQHISPNLNSSLQALKSPLIQSFHFKDLLFDSLEGKLHQIVFLGSISNQQKHSNPNLQNQTLKQLAHILFKIGQEQKNFYPHLLTHIKEQFYKPNILSHINLSHSLKVKYFQLVGIFFNQNSQTPHHYEEFITQNPQFQEIFMLILKNISTEDKKLLSINPFQKQINVQINPFQLIDKICRKFLIQIYHFGYQNPPIQMIAIANQERFVFINESNTLFLLKLQKFQLLNVRRKSSHNISFLNKESNLQQIQKPKKKKNSWNDLSGTACFGGGDISTSNHRQNLQLNMVQSDETSNYDSSFLKSQSKANQISDQSTPKFKNSSIAHIRKKSHKDSFGGVDFDNLVYKDLSNPKRHKGLNVKNRNHDKNFTEMEKQNKKVLSQRFQTHKDDSLVCGQQQDSSIQFLPHFQMGQTSQNERSLSLYGDSPNSPAYSHHNYANFSSFSIQGQFQNPKNLLIKKMKGSNIQRSSEYFNYEDESNLNQLILKHKNSSKKQNDYHKQNFKGSRQLTTSQIIQSSGIQQNHHFELNRSQIQQSEDFLIIPSLNLRANTEGKTSNTLTQKDVFMSFSKNDKLKFIIPDFPEIASKELYNQVDQTILLKKASQNIEKTINQRSKTQHVFQKQCKSEKQRKYSFRTQKQEREKYRIKLKLEQQSSLSQINFYNKFGKPTDLNAKTYSTYQQKLKNQKSNFHVHYKSTSEIQFKQQKEVHMNENKKETSKLQRKTSSNIPVYKAAYFPEQNKQEKQPEINFVNTRQFVSKRFEENSVRFSQILDNRDDQIFYVQAKDNTRQSFGTKKQRKVTDIYEGPLINVKKGGNRTSQIIQNSRKKQLTHHNNHFQSNLNIYQDNSDILINSGGGKNYSVLSNISYDEQKRLEDLLEMQNHLTSKENKNQSLKMNQFQNTLNYQENQLDFGNFQAIERLIFKKKQQKNKLQTQQISISIPNKNLILNEPQNWVKKQIFYFFNTDSGESIKPIKKLILNKNLQNSVSYSKTGRIVNFKDKRFDGNNSSKQYINSSASLYNFSPLLKQNPQTNLERESFLSNQHVFPRKYSTQQIRPLLEAKNNDLIRTQQHFNQNNETFSNFGHSNSSSFQRLKHETKCNEKSDNSNFYLDKTYDQESAKTIQLSLKNKNVFFSANPLIKTTQKINADVMKRENKEISPKIKFTWQTPNDNIVSSPAKTILDLTGSIVNGSAQNKSTMIKFV